MKNEQQLYELAFSHYGAGRYEDAQQLLLLLCGINPLQILNWHALGAAQYMLLDYEKARQSLEVALSLDHQHAETAVLLADVYLHLDMPKAAASLIHALKQDKSLNSLEKKIEWLQFRLKAHEAKSAL